MHGWYCLKQRQFITIESECSWQDGLWCTTATAGQRRHIVLRVNHSPVVHHGLRTASQRTHRREPCRVKTARHAAREGMHESHGEISPVACPASPASSACSARSSPRIWGRPAAALIHRS